MTPVDICCGSGGGFSTKRDRHSERRLRSVRIISGLYMDAWGSIFMGSHRPSLAVCLSSLLVALQQVAVYRCVCVFCVCVNDGPVKAPITRLLIKEQFICLFISPKTFTSKHNANWVLFWMLCNLFSGFKWQECVYVCVCVLNTCACLFAEVDRGFEVSDSQR